MSTQTDALAAGAFSTQSTSTATSTSTPLIGVTPTDPSLQTAASTPTSDLTSSEAATTAGFSGSDTVYNSTTGGSTIGGASPSASADKKSFWDENKYYIFGAVGVVGVFVAAKLLKKKG